MLALGGTIAMAGTVGGGVAPALSAEELLAAVPGLAGSGIEVRAAQFRQLPGASLSLADVLAASAEAAARLADGADGVVVVQGTDTIEETAYLLELLHDGPRPIVVTGAMRNPTMAGADGPANLDAAIRVAAADAASGLGCVVVLNDQIHAAARVAKTHTANPAAFASPGAGPLGWIAEQSVHVVARPVRRRALPRPPGPIPPIGLYTVTLGDTGAALPAYAAAHAGLVVAAMGVGHVPVDLVEPLGEAAARIPVVLASRTGAGSVHATTYGFAGSERDLLARNLIGAGDRNPYQARILLGLLLATGADRKEIRVAFGGTAAFGA